jgi:hypothetical protein
LRGTSSFAVEFPRRGPRDSRGRSLRDLDLKTRLFRYPLSYMIYSEAFDGLPEPFKEQLYASLLDVLTGKESKDFPSTSLEEGRVLMEILLATKKGLPPEWSRRHRERDGDPTAPRAPGDPLDSTRRVRL